MFAFRALARKRKIWLVAFVMSVVTALPASVSTADEVSLAKYRWPTASPLQGNPMDYPLLGYHFGIVDDFTQGAGGEASSFFSVGGSVQPLCTGFNDPICQREIAKGNGWWLNAILPPCSTVTISTACVEGVQLSDKSGTRELTLKKILSGPIWNVDSNHGSIPGSAPSLWVDPNEKDQTLGYKVTAGGALSVIGSPTFPTATSFNTFQSNISAYKEVKGNYRGYSPGTNSDGVTHASWGGAPGCIWSDDGVCGIQTDFTAGVRLQLRVHLPVGLTPWLIGRISNPEISISDSVGYPNIKIVKVEAEPVMVPLFIVDVPLEKATQTLKDTLSKPNNFICDPRYPICSHGYAGGNTSTSYPTAFSGYELFREYLADKSNIMIPTWSVRTVVSGFPPPVANCSLPLFYGLVTTNASIYEGSPPKWNGSSLEYKVAGLHFDPDGNVFQGSYDLIMNSQYARCLYKFTAAPITATVSIVDAEGTNSVATTSFQEKDGWVHMAARGFTFSSPTLKVVLQQSNPAPKPVPSASPSIAKSDSKVVSITCTKGKTVKKVSGTAPKCPAGYTVKKK